MSTLKKIQDENRESKFGYVYAVSGPGKLNSFSLFYLVPLHRTTSHEYWKNCPIFFFVII